jgi:hypothetical protein
MDTHTTNFSRLVRIVCFAVFAIIFAILLSIVLLDPTPLAYSSWVHVTIM